MRPITKSTERRVPRITGLPTNTAGSRTMRKGSVMDFSLSIAILSQFYPVAYLGDNVYWCDIDSKGICHFVWPCSVSYLPFVICRAFSSFSLDQPCIVKFSKTNPIYRLTLRAVTWAPRTRRRARGAGTKMGRLNGG